MKHLKLKRGLSYAGYGVTASKASPDVLVEDESTAAALLASGYFKEVAVADEPKELEGQTSLFDEEHGEGESESEDHGEGEDTGDGEESGEGEKSEQGGAVEAIDTMGVTKLREYAKKHGIAGNWPAGTQADVIREDIRKALAERE